MPDYNQDYLRVKQRAVQRARARGEHPHHAADRSRVPPGQAVTKKFPILDLGVRPGWDPATWRLTITGLVEHPQLLTWDEFRRLPRVEQVSDFHCVTRWSKLDVHWGGVRVRTITELAHPLPATRFVIQGSADGYSTNVALDEMLVDDVLLADELEGEPLPLEHGGPLRVIIPGLYAWKGAKFLRSLEFTSEDCPGFWETRGYHNHGDPWSEERTSEEWWM